MDVNKQTKGVNGSYRKIGRRQSEITFTTSHHATISATNGTGSGSDARPSSSSSKTGRRTRSDGRASSNDDDGSDKDSKSTKKSAQDDDKDDDKDASGDDKKAPSKSRNRRRDRERDRRKERQRKAAEAREAKAKEKESNKFITSSSYHHQCRLYLDDLFDSFPSLLLRVLRLLYVVVPCDDRARGHDDDYETYLGLLIITRCIFVIILIIVLRALLCALRVFVTAIVIIRLMLVHQTVCVVQSYYCSMMVVHPLPLPVPLVAEDGRVVRRREGDFALPSSNFAIRSINAFSLRCSRPLPI